MFGKDRAQLRASTQKLEAGETKEAAIDEVIATQEAKRAAVRKRLDETKADRERVAIELTTLRRRRDDLRAAAEELQGDTEAQQVELAGLDQESADLWSATALQQQKLVQLQFLFKSLALARSVPEEASTNSVGALASAAVAPPSPSCAARLLAVPAEAGELLAPLEPPLRAQLAEAVAKTALAEEEQQVFESEMSHFVEQLTTLRVQHHALQRRQEAAATELNQVAQETRSGRKRRGVLQAELVDLSLANKRLTQLHSKVVSDAGRHKGLVEGLRETAWKEIGKTKHVVEQTGQAIKRNATEHQQNAVEVRSRMAAHARVLQGPASPPGGKAGRPDSAPEGAATRGAPAISSYAAASHRTAAQPQQSGSSGSPVLGGTPSLPPVLSARTPRTDFRNAGHLVVAHTPTPS